MNGLDGRFVVKEFSMRRLSILFTVIFSLTALASTAQKRETLTNDEEIITKAQSFLDQQFKNGELKLEAEKRGIKGDFVLDITLYKNGNVLTVYSPFEISDEKVRPQNQLKDLLMTCEFPFKLPKNKRVKFRQNFSFS